MASPTGSNSLRIIALLSTFSLLSGACGGAQTGGTIGGTPHREIRAPAPSVPAYSTTAAGPAVTGSGPEMAAAVSGAVTRASEAHSIPLEGDGRLATLASWLSERLGAEGEVPPTEVIAFFARHLGLVEPVPHVIVLGQPPGDLPQALESSVGQFLERQPYSHFGAHVIRRGGLDLAVVVLSWRWVELLEMPRRMAEPGPLFIRGELASNYRNPVIVLVDPSGAIERMPAGAGPGLDVRIPAEETGTYQVEIVAHGPRGSSVLANFPVQVGVDIPETLAIAAEVSQSPGDVQSARRQLLDLINELRREHGVPELADDESARGVALAHSQEMLASGYVGHTSAQTGTPTQRVARAHIQTGLVLENIGRGYSVQEIHRGLIDSPGHRANLLNPDVTHVGIGVVLQSEESRNALLVTEVFIRQAAAVDLVGGPTSVLEHLNRTRRARGAAALSSEPHLATAAQEAAEAFFADPSLSQQDTVDDASAGLRRFAVAYRRIGGVMAIVSELDEAGALEPALESDIRFVGVGVAQGTRADTGPNAVAVVIVLAWPR